MAKYFIAFLACTALFLGAIITLRSAEEESQKKTVEKPQQISFKNSTSSIGGEKRSLFVPYWTVKNEHIDVDSFHSIIYFGITPGNNGINKKDEGYLNLASFVKNNSSKNAYLTVRMTNADNNFNVLANKSLQEKIIIESLQLTKQYSFEGIILDLEVSSLPFNSVVDQINTFVKDFYKESKKENIRFSITLYGDTFSRLRPYDVSFLSKQADTFYIMAYDFHKSNGNPGPNFPLLGAKKYGYDFQTMISDYLNVIPKEKITVVFGMFGYDWEIDEKGNSSTQAASLSLNQIKNKFIGQCEFKDCKVIRDKQSSESSIEYIDEDSKQHVVWFEDEESIKQKEEFLKGKGINSISFWAYSFY